MVAVAASKHLVELLFQVCFAFRRWLLGVLLELPIVLPKQVLHFCYVLPLLFGVSLQATQRPFCMDPTQPMQQDIELSSAITENPQRLPHPLSDDSTQQGSNGRAPERLWH